jgi:hypothetical protein
VAACGLFVRLTASPNVEKNIRIVEPFLLTLLVPYAIIISIKIAQTRKKGGAIMPNIMLLCVCLGCAITVIFLKLFVRGSSRWLLVLAASFLISIVADYSLATRISDVGFILGILGFLVAHVGFIIYGWKFITGAKKFSLVVLSVITVPFVIFYFLALYPSQPLQESSILSAAVLFYLLVSCFTLAVSIDAKNGFKPSWSWIYAGGVLCLLASDTLIALNDFLGMNELFDLYMFPLFYASYIFITISVVAKHTLTAT